MALEDYPRSRSFGARFMSPLAASVDRFVARGLTGRSEASRKKSAAESLGPDERELALGRIESTYAAASPFEDVERFFGARRAADPKLVQVGKRRAGKVDVDVFDATWSSRVTTFCEDDALASRFASVKENHHGAARLFLGRGSGRPAAIVVHGYRAGQYGIEERVWPTSWLLEKGMDVAFFVLPFHAVRAEPKSAPRFPGSDPRFTNEGFRQAIDDLRSLAAFLEARGAPAVGAMGMSLGGYTVALYATVDDALAFAAMMIPLASFADVALDAGRFVGTREQQKRQHELLERAHGIVSPFARAPKVAADCVVVAGAEGDRITPIAHADKLARHFGTELVTFTGGHLLQFGRAEGFRAIGRMLGRRGLFDAR